MSRDRVAEIATRYNDGTITNRDVAFLLAYAAELGRENELLLRRVAVIDGVAERLRRAYEPEGET